MDKVHMSEQFSAKPTDAGCGLTLSHFPDCLAGHSRQEGEDKVSAVTRAFSGGLLSALASPVEGSSQLLGMEIKAPEVQASSDLAPSARSAGAILGSALLFYGANCAIRSALPSVGVYGSVIAGAALGFLEPVEHNSLEARLANTTRGAATMSIMEWLPGYLASRHLRNDLLGQTMNVVCAGATAGAVDVNLESLFSKRELASLKDTASSALGWGAMAGVFHVSSLFLGSKFQVRQETKSPQLLLLGPDDTPQDQHVRDYLNSLSSMGVEYKAIDTGKFGLSSLLGDKTRVLFPDGSRIGAGDLGKLSAKLNLHEHPSYPDYRVAVIGSGPGGVQSAINAASELPPQQRVALISDVPGGQARFTSSIKNYMGYQDVSGAELMKQGLAGARARGAELIVNRVESISQESGHHILTLRDGSKIAADAVVLAPGMKYNQLNVPDIEKFADKGVHTLADAHDVDMMSGKDVMVVGAGNSAGQAAINFSHAARDVQLLVRGPNLEKSMSQYLIDEIKQRPNIKVHLQTEVKALHGDSHLDSVLTSTRSESGIVNGKMNADALYVYIGGVPNTGFLKNSGIGLDPKGFVLTGNQVADARLWTGGTRGPLPYETSVPGIFAVGDANAANPQKRVVSAVGDAGKMIGSLHSFLAGAAKVTAPAAEALPGASVPVNGGMPELYTKGLLRGSTGAFDFGVSLPSFTAVVMRAAGAAGRDDCKRSQTANSQTRGRAVCLNN